jgi:hypothetical protein
MVTLRDVGIRCSLGSVRVQQCAARCGHYCGHAMATDPLRGPGGMKCCHGCCVKGVAPEPRQADDNVEGPPPGTGLTAFRDLIGASDVAQGSIAMHTRGTAG